MATVPSLRLDRLNVPKLWFQGYVSVTWIQLHVVKTDPSLYGFEPTVYHFGSERAEYCGNRTLRMYQNCCPSENQFQTWFALIAETLDYTLRSLPNNSNLRSNFWLCDPYYFNLYLPSVPLYHIPLSLEGIFSWKRLVCGTYSLTPVLNG